MVERDCMFPAFDTCVGAGSIPSSISDTVLVVHAKYVYEVKCCNIVGESPNESHSHSMCA